MTNRITSIDDLTDGDVNESFAEHANKETRPTAIIYAFDYDTLSPDKKNEFDKAYSDTREEILSNKNICEARRQAAIAGLDAVFAEKRFYELSISGDAMPIRRVGLEDFAKVLAFYQLAADIDTATSEQAAKQLPVFGGGRALSLHEVKYLSSQGINLGYKLSDTSQAIHVPAELLSKSHYKMTGT